MILQTVSISAAPRELHIKLFKVHGDELEKLEKEIASLDAVALVFEAVKAPGVVAHWEVQHEIDGKTYTEQRILHASVKNLGCIQFSTAHIYPDEYIPVMDSQFKNASDFSDMKRHCRRLLLLKRLRDTERGDKMKVIWESSLQIEKMCSSAERAILCQMSRGFKATCYSAC